VGEKSRKSFIAVTIAGWLLTTVQIAKPDACACGGEDGRALCIGGDVSSDVAASLRLPVTLELRSGGTNRQLSDGLSRITGKRIATLPSKPDEPVNVDIKRAALRDMLEMFSERGTVQIEGEDFSKLQSVRKALAGGEKSRSALKVAGSCFN
jgi:hypothetical protein